MTSSEDKDKAIAFYKNRLDLALAHQKELSTLFFKVTIGYFPILYGVFSIYKILYDAHFGNANLLLFVILCFLSSSFCFWGSLSLAELFFVDLYVQIYQDSLDRTLMKSAYSSQKKLISNLEEHLSVQRKKGADIEELEKELVFLKGVHNNLDEKVELFRKISYYTNSHRLLMVLVTVILGISIMIFVYTLVKMPTNVLMNINLYDLKIPINCQPICIVYAIILLFVFVIVFFRYIKRLIQVKSHAGKIGQELTKELRVLNSENDPL